MLVDLNKLFVFESLLTMPSNVLPSHLKQTFPPIIWIFTEGEGDGIESRLLFKIFSTLTATTKTLNLYHIECILTYLIFNKLEKMFVTFANILKWPKVFIWKKKWSNTCYRKQTALYRCYLLNWLVVKFIYNSAHLPFALRSGSSSCFVITDMCQEIRA